MGYGKKLKAILDEQNITVKELARQSKIAPTTLYSIISRDTAIRYDYALRVANILNVPVGSLCGDIPYDEGTTEPGLLSNFGGLATELNKKTYFSNRTLEIARKFNSEEFPMLDKLIAEFYVLDDEARNEVFQFLKMKHETHIDPEREKNLKDIK